MSAGVAPLGGLFSAFALVALLCLVAGLLAWRRRQAVQGSAESAAIRIVAVQRLGPGERLLLVEVAERRTLISHGPKGVVVIDGPMAVPLRPQTVGAAALSP